MDKLKFLMQKNHIKSVKEHKVLTEEITREEFDLLDMQDDNTIYYILEDDGTITIVKGENK